MYGNRRMASTSGRMIHKPVSGRSITGRSKWNARMYAMPIAVPGIARISVLRPSSVGATGVRSFRDITLPLIWRGVLVGSLFSFVTSLQEASAVLFLSLGGWETIPVGIFAFYIAGSANEAAALGVILIAVAAVSVTVINRIAGARMGGMFG